MVPPTQQRPGGQPGKGGRHGSGGGPADGGAAGPPRRLPEPRPIEYFAKAAPTALNPQLVDDDARKLAEEIGDVPASQIRRFYADVSAFDRRLAADPKMPKEAIQAQMGLLKAKAAYARGRKTITEPMLQFFVDHAAAVKDRKDFDAFRRVFEAVIAYHKFYEVKQRRD